MSLLATLVEVTRMLDQAKIEFVIGGSLASSLWGQERTTHDADLAILLSEDQLNILDSLIGWPYVMDTDSIRSMLSDSKDFASGQILNGDTLDKIDLFLLKDEPYTRSRFSRRRYVEVEPGTTLPFSSPEDSVISKLRWYVLGNCVSDRQWTDIVQVLEMQAGQLDEAYLEHWTHHFGVQELFHRAQGEVVAQ